MKIHTAPIGINQMRKANHNHITKGTSPMGAPLLKSALVVLTLAGGITTATFAGGDHFVKRQLEKIFGYRARILSDLLSANPLPSANEKEMKCAEV